MNFHKKEDFKMSRYKIWDKKETIYTLTGEELTAEQWVDRYKWANKPGVKMIIGAGSISGTVAMEFNATIEHYKKQGCQIDMATMTDEQVLQAIEDFEDTPPVVEPDTTERMVALEEFKTMTTMPEYQVPLAIVEKNFKRGLWTKSMVETAVAKGSITITEKDSIIGVVEPVGETTK
jgi:hypothetical protein